MRKVKIQVTLRKCRTCSQIYKFRRSLSQRLIRSWSSEWPSKRSRVIKSEIYCPYMSSIMQKRSHVWAVLQTYDEPCLNHSHCPSLHVSSNNLTYTFFISEIMSYLLKVRLGLWSFHLTHNDVPASVVNFFTSCQSSHTAQEFLSSFHHPNFTG